MTREEAIKTLHELWRETNDPWYEEVYSMAIDALHEQPQGEWIPCSERLPENGYWLWSATSGEVKKDFYWEGHWELAEKFGYEVVAWMPLPKAYVGAE